MNSTRIALALLIAGCRETSVEPTPNCQEFANFAAWCQKAHPDVWREYYSTIGGE